MIVDSSSIGRVEPAGAAEWRGFVKMVAPLVDALYLASVPPAFLEKLCSPEDLAPKGRSSRSRCPTRAPRAAPRRAS